MAIDAITPIASALPSARERAEVATVIGPASAARRPSMNTGPSASAPLITVAVALSAMAVMAAPRRPRRPSTAPEERRRHPGDRRQGEPDREQRFDRIVGE